MAFGFTKGTLTKPESATGNQTVTVPGTSFEIKALLVWGAGRTATGYSDTGAMSLGFTDGANQFCRSTEWADNATVADEAQAQSPSKLIWGINASGATRYAAEVVSLGTGEFTIDWTANDGVAGRVFHYVAIGGDDASASCGSLTGATSRGNDVVVTGVGFEPNLLICLPFFANPGTEQTADTGLLQGFGFGTTAFNWNGLAFSYDGDSTSWTRRRQIFTEPGNDGSCLNDIITSAIGTGIVGLGAHVSAFGSDGFTLHFTAVLFGSFASRPIPYLALRVPSVSVGVISQRSGTGTQTTALGIEVAGLLLCSTGQVSNDLVEAEARWAFGAADGTRQGCDWVGDKHNVGTTQSASYHSTTSTIVGADPAATGSSSAAVFEAALDEFPDDGFTLDYSTADSTARKIMYVAFGGAIDTPTPPPAEEPEFTSDEAIAGGSIGLTWVEVRNWHRQTLGTWTEST